MNNNTAQEKKVKDLFRWYDGITKYMVRELNDAIKKSENEETINFIGQKIVDNTVSLSRLPGVIGPMKSIVETMRPIEEHKEPEHTDVSEDSRKLNGAEALEEVFKKAAMYFRYLQEPGCQKVRKMEELLSVAIPGFLNIHNELKSILYTTAELYPEYIDFNDIYGDDDDDENE